MHAPANTSPTPAAPAAPQPLFHLDGDRFVPGPLTRGPWYGGAVHGSAVLALAARAAQQHPSTVARHVVRLTADMLRAAPMVPLRVEATTARAGKHIDHLDIAVFAGDELCVRATALRMRVAEVGVPDGFDEATFPLPPREVEVRRPPIALAAPDEPGFHHAVDLHADVDQHAMWFRLASPVVAGEPNSGLLTVAAAADWAYAAPSLLRFASGAASPTEPPALSTINADTTCNLHRPLAGSWLGVRTVARIGPHGAGTSSAELFDERGAMGFTSQSVLVRPAVGAARPGV